MPETDELTIIETNLPDDLFYLLHALPGCKTKIITEGDIHDRNRMDAKVTLYIMFKIKKPERMGNSGPKAGMRRVSHRIVITNAQFRQPAECRGKRKLQKMLAAARDSLTCCRLQSLDLLL